MIEIFAWLMLAVLLFILDVDVAYPLSAIVCSQIWMAVWYLERKTDAR